MKYRADIDGLRALAILPVIFFHAGFGLFDSGFLGVDIFFVVSGFLITSLILKDISLNRFSVFNFYERRARRLLPALFLVCIVSLPLGWLVLLPSDLTEFGKSIITTLTFSSNFLFWQQAGYFDIESDLKPLLHTWSLAVEEQFYILYPLFLILFWKFGLKRVLSLLIIIFFISFIVSNWAAFNKPAANFYLLPTRGWEILAGAIPAFILKIYPRSFKSYAINSILSLIGFVLIIASFVYLSPETLSPSFKTLPLILGTVLILIFFDKSSPLSKFLSLKPIVFIGLISYSWYLWHLPVLAFAKNYSLTGISNLSIVLLIILSFVLACFSWKFVEKPIRDGILSKKNFILSISALSLSIIVFSFFLIFNEKSINNIPNDYLEPNYGIKDRECNFKTIDECILNTESELILWGDSYAMHLSQAISSSATKILHTQVTKNTCSPVINTSKTIRNIQFADECINFNNIVLKSIVANSNIKYVILSSTFSFDNNRPIKINSQYYDDFNNKLILENFNKTIKILKQSGKQVLIISPTPSTRDHYDPARCSLNALKRNISPEICFFNKQEYSKKTMNGYNLLEAVENNSKILWIDSLICEKNICKTVIDGQPIYRDNGHLSSYGSNFIGKKFNLNEIILEKINSSD